MNIGDSVTVIHEEQVPSNDPEEGWVTKTSIDHGTVTATGGSNKFTWGLDDFDFDYQLENEGAVRSVDLDSEKVCQLHYDAGGDRDWSTFSLKKVEVEGEQIFWRCGSCGASEHDAIDVMDGEIEMDVTCETVYLTFNDDSGDPGMAFDHDTFRRMLAYYWQSEYAERQP